MIRLDLAAILAYVAAVTGTPDAASGVRIGPDGTVHAHGGTLSPAALELAQAIRAPRPGQTKKPPPAAPVGPINP